MNHYKKYPQFKDQNLEPKAHPKPKIDNLKYLEHQITSCSQDCEFRLSGSKIVVN